MCRATPVTYFINAVISTGLAGSDIICAGNEILKFNPAEGQECASYLQEYINNAGGSLLNPEATQQCHFCPFSSTDSLLATLGIFFEHRRRSYAITIVYSVSNAASALFLYCLFRVPKGARRRNM